MNANTPRRITPTTLTATELADYLSDQAIAMRHLFKSGNHDTRTGAITVHEATFALVKALRDGTIAPVVAQVRIIGINRTAARYYVSGVTAHRTA